MLVEAQMCAIKDNYCLLWIKPRIVRVSALYYCEDSY